jgi:hypothetical protein
MGAFNTVTFEGCCPACGNISKITAQTHVAADAMYNDVDYRLGETMEWYEKSDPEYGRWLDDADGRVVPSGNTAQACYADCNACGAQICAVIEFEEIRPLRCLQLATKKDWVDGFPR